jgi:ribosomal protein L29
MKTNTKKRLREMTKKQLNKRLKYLKSKLPEKKTGSNEIRYIQYQLKRR